jgi:hypothetical protein
MTFLKYLAESEKTYKYRLKTVSIDLGDDEILERIHAYLQRFKLVDISKPFETIIQRSPLDFPNYTNTTVSMIDFETSFPLSSYVASEEIRTLLNVVGGAVVVRGANEPIEIETKLMNQKENVWDQAEDKDLKPAPLLGVDSQYPAGEQLPAGDNYYGDAYNSRLVQVLKDIEDSRKPTKFDPPAPLFSWLDMEKVKSQEPVQDDANFNAEVVEKPKAKEDKDAMQVVATGNYSTQDMDFKKDFINPRTGAAKTIVPKMTKGKK